MFVLDEEKLNLILTEMAAGLARSPLEIAIFAVLVLSIIAALVVLNRRQVRKAREEAVGRSQRMFGQLVRKRRLGYSDVSILESLSTYLADSSQKHQVLENQNIFNTCARKLMVAGHATGTEIAALRLKLGFRSRAPEQVFQSSAQLHEGIPVVVVQREKKGCRGKIDAVQPQMLGITLDDECDPFKRNHQVRVYFQTPAGRFAFSTKVRRIGRGRVELFHSESIKRLQRRQFYRKKLMLPVYVRHAGVQEQAVPTTIIDLGGGGASLANEDMRFNVGDRISLSVFPASQDKINVTGGVIRISKDGKVAHVEFDHMMESNRDRIMGFLFKPPKG
jgi:c-di-GMP-binding flagellar brake protein YcgR